MTLEPLRSFMSVQQVEETSLAIPSDNKLRSGQQRVLDQVHTIKRSRSRSGSHGSGSISSASPVTTNNFNKNVISRINLGSLAGSTKTTRNTVRRKVFSTSQYEKAMYGTCSPDGPLPTRMVTLKQSRSNPELVPQPQPPSTSHLSHQSTYISTASTQSPVFLSQPSFAQTPSAFSNVESKMSISKVKNGVSMVGNGITTKDGSDITLKQAVEFLSSQDENYQNFGASFIQHATFSDEKTKKEVSRLKGIPPLVALLRSASPQVQETACGALRNLVFKDNNNKLEVQRSGGITDAVMLLKSSDSDEMQKQLTGLLWNLSSSDDVKPDLIQSAAPVLTEAVLLPFAGLSEQIPSSSVDPEVFYNTTACLRNLSSVKQGNRQAMRNCHGLIDSLVSYVQSCVDANRPDDKSVENCVCILHNLTYQLEMEAPGLFSKITALARMPSKTNMQGSSSSMGCFSTQSDKAEQESHFDYPVMEDNNPKGPGWLFHSTTMQTYLSLLESSQKESTREACMGALQNLTANNGTVSAVMSQTIVQKLSGLQQITPFLQTSNSTLKKMAVSLVGNLSRAPRLQSTLARQALPQLAGFLSTGTKDGADADDTMATGCHTIRNLLQAEPEAGKKLLNNTFINSLTDLSRNRCFPKSSQAAGLLLYGLWAEKDFQSLLKKKGMHKDSFVNDVTTFARKTIVKSVT